MNPLCDKIRQLAPGWTSVLLLMTCWLCLEKSRGRADEKTVISEKKVSVMDDRTRAVVAASSVVGLSEPVTAYTLVQAGNGFSLWSGLPESLEPDVSKAPPLVNLESVKDGEPIRSGEEGLAFCEALVKAHQTSDQAFRQSATRGLTYANLFNEPQLHRGKVIHFEGLLRRLSRFEPPAETKLDGVKDQYEGWMFDPERYGANPVCVVFTDLPAGLETGDKLDTRVSVDGYFFKKYRYKSADGTRDAPLLIARTLTVKQAPSKPDSEEGGFFSGFMAVTFMAALGGVFLLALLLTLWYRRSDRQVQQRLMTAQTSSFAMPPGEAQEPEGHGMDVKE
jgi:hypothetical protein